MPFGSKNSGATFQKMMYNILLNEANVKCYVYDVLIRSEDEESNIKH